MAVETPKTHVRVLALCGGAFLLWGMHFLLERPPWFVLGERKTCAQQRHTCPNHPS